MSVLDPSTRPSRITSVLTDSTAPSTSSQSATTASLCGVVTLAPRNPIATIPRTASSSCSGATPSGTYATSSASAAKAAFCIRGEREPTFGSRRSPTRAVVPPITTQPQEKPYSQAFWKNSDSLAVKKWWILSGLRTK